MTILRKVKSEQFHQSKNARPGCGTIQSLLECGHRVYVKSSAGYANKRKCRDCSFLAKGGKIGGGGYVEIWDAASKMPVKTSTGTPHG